MISIVEYSCSVLRVSTIEQRCVLADSENVGSGKNSYYLMRFIVLIEIAVQNIKRKKCALND